MAKTPRDFGRRYERGDKIGRGDLPEHFNTPASGGNPPKPPKKRPPDSARLAESPLAPDAPWDSCSKPQRKEFLSFLDRALGQMGVDVNDISWPIVANKISSVPIPPLSNCRCIERDIIFVFSGEAFGHTGIRVNQDLLAQLLTSKP